MLHFEIHYPVGANASPVPPLILIFLQTWNKYQNYACFTTM